MAKSTAIVEVLVSVRRKLEHNLLLTRCSNQGRGRLLFLFHVWSTRQ
uniref:Uncharacterized protein n=1 Tax=Arundo donax TaxID=35708 RepID=A0A0A8XNA0_ARUDO